MQPGSGGVPTRQRGFPKCPAVLGWVAAGQNGFLQFAEEPYFLMPGNSSAKTRTTKITASSNKAAITFAATATSRAIIIGNSVLFFILTFLS